MFDLPSTSKADQRRYRQFVKRLEMLGFVRLQYSVFYRLAPNKDVQTRIERELKICDELKGGHVLLFNLTEKQFEDRVKIFGGITQQEELVGKNRLVIL